MENEQNVNPLLSRIQMPGETFTLPSGGVFYTNNELSPDTQNAEVHVLPMTAIDEIVMRTPDMLFSGDAVRQVVGRCVPQVTDVDGLLAKDIDFLLMCLRKVSYGEDLTMDYKHSCKDANVNSYPVDVTQFIRNAKRIDPTTFETEFSVKLPNDQEVKLRPIRYKEFVDIMQSSDESTMSPEQIRDTMINSLAQIIVRVDEVTEQAHIIEWLGSLTPQYLKMINAKLDDTVKWGPDFTTTIVCKDCGEKVDIEAPLNPLTFFM